MPERMRVDAARNYVQVLDAARRVIVRSGPDVALEQIAAEAGVGIATLYRRFHDRGGLLTAVATSALEEAERAALAAEASDSQDGLAAIESYLRSMVHNQAAAVVPMLVSRSDVDSHAIDVTRERTARAVARLTDAAHRDGSLSRAISEGDIGIILVRLSRPLPGALPADVERQLQMRHLAILVLGLRHSDGLDLTGPSFDQLRPASDWPATSDDEGTRHP